MSNSDKICLKGLRFEAIHGVYDEEKQRKQPFCINIEMDVDTRAAAAADDIGLSVDYSRVYERVRRVVQENSFNLLETLAHHIARAVLADKNVQKVRVEAEKLCAAWQDEHFTSGVIIERRQL